MVCALLGGRQRLAGVMWGLLALVKILPVFLLFPILLWRRWRLLQGFLAINLLYFILLVATGRVGEEWFFVNEVMPAIPRWWRGISIIPGRFVMLALGLHESVYMNPHGFDLVSRTSLICWLVFYLWLLIWMRRRGVDWLRALEMAILTYPLLTPLLEYHHFVWIMPALLLHLRRWLSGQMSLRIAMGLLAGWVILNAGFPFVFQLSKFGQWSHFPVLFGYGLLIVVAIVELAGETATSPRPAQIPKLIDSSAKWTTLK